jgi:hypothetical protein
MKIFLRRKLAGALVLPVVASVLAATASSPAALAAHRTGPYDLAPGVEMWRIRYPGPYQVRVLRIDPAQATIDVYPAAPTFGTITRVSTQAEANGAIAAVNGDFGTFRGMPVHPNMIDAVLRTSGLARGSSLSVNESGDRAWAKTPTEVITATTASHSFPVRRLNAGTARRKEIVAFTKPGGSIEQPASDMCAARLSPNGPSRWSDANQSGISRTYTVDAQPDPCRFAALGFGSTSDPGTVILQAKRTCRCAAHIKALTVGDSIDLTWETQGRPDTTDEIGGMPLLVRAGANVAPGPNAGASYFFDRNPRTGVGITRGCTDTDLTTQCYVYLITVDGRQAGWSVGMTFTRFAQEFLHQSPPAYYAFNLDGGGASEMWVAHSDSAYCQLHPPPGGCTVNRPSDGHERAAISSLQVLSGADPGDPHLTGGVSFTDGSASPAIAPVSLDAWARLVSTDPGSTGGLAAALQAGWLGPPPEEAVLRSLLGPGRHPLLRAP